MATNRTPSELWNSTDWKEEIDVVSFRRARVSHVIIDDRIKLLAETAAHTPPARLQREMAALVEKMVGEAVEKAERPRYIYHPFEGVASSVEEAMQRHIERLEERLVELRAYAEERGYADVVVLIDGPAIA